MAVICGIHCLVTPVLLMVLPIIATTFWIDENFHLWILFLVIPTMSLAVWSGCRRHKDKWVFVSAILGLSILVSALLVERLHHHSLHQGDSEVATSMVETSDADGVVSDHQADQHFVGGGCCSLHPAKRDSLNGGKNGMVQTNTSRVPWHAILNALGGFFWWLVTPGNLCFAEKPTVITTNVKIRYNRCRRRRPPSRA